jgi:hypothetical protein
MEIPTPPTDSLYKFKAIGGIILMLAPLYVAYKIDHDIRERLNRIDVEVMVEKADADFRSEINHAKEGHPQGGTRVTGQTPPNSLAPVTNEAEALEAARKKWAEIEARHRHLGRSMKESWFLIPFCLLLTYLGYTYTRDGFREWRKNIQEPQDQLLQIQLEQSSLALAKMKATAALPAEAAETPATSKPAAVPPTETLPKES